VGVGRGLWTIGVTEVTGGDVSVRRTLFAAGWAAGAAAAESWSMVAWVVQPVTATAATKMTVLMIRAELPGRCGRPQPQRRLGRLDRLVDHGQQLGAHGRAIGSGHQ
jgi:hypothetical protein